jgi:glycosyltransferase involved in cell wall biosynthesis
MRLRLLYVVTEDWYFLSHRLPMARAAREAGFDVHVATRVVDGRAPIEAEGFTLHQVPFARGRLSPLETLATIRALRRLHRKVQPHIVHHVSVQSAVLGSLAALARPVARVNALTGLGYVFTSDNAKTRLVRPIMQGLIRRLVDRPGSIALVQNDDDRGDLRRIGVDDDRIVLIPGSGVDTATLGPTPEPQAPPTFAFVGRLLRDKGVQTLIAAHRIARMERPDLRLLIAGTPDPANPASIPASEAEDWNGNDGIEWLGHVTDIAGLWARSHVAVLPSRREGLPKSLLEAAACGRPMIATDVPGCREIAIPGRTGVLVPPDDAPALARAMIALADAPELRARYGAAARDLAVSRFSSDAIGEQTVALYRSMLRP